MTEPPEVEPLPVLTEPMGGVPPVVDTPERLARTAAQIAAADGPVAIDAERASGYRYSQRAYLIQLKRGEDAVHLVDPVAFDDLDPLVRAVGAAEWELHAATQDIPCLAEVGLVPNRLFDTELGARLAGLPRVGLGAVVEHYLGVSLVKEHSAVDWSQRPLPESWLRYAALDVDVLHRVRLGVEADLRAQGKLDWAHQEFEALTRFRAAPPRADPWRRTSGMHRVRGRRGLGAVRELWQTRDVLAQDVDAAPGRILPDPFLVDLAARAPRAAAELINPQGVTRGGQPRRPHRGLHRYAAQWLDALDRVRAMAQEDLPAQRLELDGPPPHRVWGERNPAAAQRLAGTRTSLAGLSEQLGVPVENLLTPDTVRRVLWEPPSDGDVARALAALGARPWQVELTAPLLADAVHAHPDQP